MTPAIAHDHKYFRLSFDTACCSYATTMHRHSYASGVPPKTGNEELGCIPL